MQEAGPGNAGFSSPTQQLHQEPLSVHLLSSTTEAKIQLTNKKLASKPAFQLSSPSGMHMRMRLLLCKTYSFIIYGT